MNNRIIQRFSQADHCLQYECRVQFFQMVSHYLNSRLNFLFPKFWKQNILNTSIFISCAREKSILLPSFIKGICDHMNKKIRWIL